MLKITILRNLGLALEGILNFSHEKYYTGKKFYFQHDKTTLNGFSLTLTLTLTLALPFDTTCNLNIYEVN